MRPQGKLDSGNHGAYYGILHGGGGGGGQLKDFVNGTKRKLDKGYLQRWL